jgi:hypothetical protein
MPPRKNQDRLIDDTRPLELRGHLQPGCHRTYLDLETPPSTVAYRIPNLLGPIVREHDDLLHTQRRGQVELQGNEGLAADG